MSNLLTLRTKALIFELAVAIALGAAVTGISGGITPQSYQTALLVAAVILIPLEVLRQTGVLDRWTELLAEFRKAQKRSVHTLEILTSNEKRTTTMSGQIRSEMNYGRAGLLNHLRYLRNSLAFTSV